MFVGPSTDVFATLQSLDLGVPLWRMWSIDERSLPGHALLLLELDPAEDIDRRVARIHASGSSTIVVAHELDDAQAFAYISAGAFGALDLRDDREILRRQLRGALRGEPVFGRAVLGRWLRAVRTGSASDEWHLTLRQREVLSLVSRGLTDRDIAAALGITIATAQKHVAHLLKKLGVANRAGAVGRALRAPATRPNGPAGEQR